MSRHATAYIDEPYDAKDLEFIDKQMRRAVSERKKLTKEAKPRKKKTKRNHGDKA